MSCNQCPATSKRTLIFPKCIYFMMKHNFGGHLGRHLEFLKTLKGAEPAPDGIWQSNLSPFRKYQNMYYTPPCHVVFGICQTSTADIKTNVILKGKQPISIKFCSVWRESVFFTYYNTRSCIISICSARCTELFHSSSMIKTVMIYCKFKKSLVRNIESMLAWFGSCITYAFFCWLGS